MNATDSIKKNCIHCNTEFGRNYNESHSRFAKRIYCGRECVEKYILEQRHKREAAMEARRVAREMAEAAAFTQKETQAHA